MYCSDECKEQHKEFYHDEHVCNRVTIVHDPYVPKHPWSEIYQRVMMTAVKEFGSFKEFFKLLKDPVKKTVFDIDELYPRNILKIFCSMSQSESRKKEFPKYGDFTPSKEGEDMFSQIFAICSTNSISLDRWIGDCDETGMTVGVFGCLFNHSCNHNIDRVTLDNKMVFYVNRPIKAGEQLFINYGALYESDSLEERREILSEYDFVCECDACTKNYPLVDGLLEVDRKHEIPLVDTSTVDLAIETFRKSCQMIDSLENDHPCSESSFLINRNDSIMNQIAEIRL